MLTDVSTVKAWARGKLDAVNDEVLERCIAAASGMVVAYCARDFERAQYTETLNGDDAAGKYGEVLHLDRGRFPVAHAASPGYVTVTENGSALTVGSGYSTTANVIVDGIGMPYPSRLIRRPSGLSSLVVPASAFVGRWCPGRQNISVTYYAGYAPGEIPAVIVQATAELSWLIFQQAGSVGVSSASKAGGSATFVADLSPIARMALDDYKAH